MNIIADTSALISLVSESDSNHKNALKIINEIIGTIIIPGEVISEFLNVLGKKTGHKIASQKAKIIFDSQSFEIAEITTEIRKDSFEKFKKQPNSVSFTDCLVMSLADEYDTKQILGFDECLKKSGYIRFGID